MSEFANDGQHGARIYYLRPRSDALGRSTDADDDMNARRNGAPSKRGTQARGQSRPSSQGFGPGSSDAHLVAAVLDVQKQLGEIKVSLQALTKTVDILVVRVDNLTSRVDNLTSRVDNLTSRVDNLTSRVDDLTAWKNKVLGGAVVAGVVATVVLALLGAGAKLVYDAARQPHIPLARPAAGCLSVAVAQHGLATPRVAVCPLRSDVAA